MGKSSDKMEQIKMTGRDKVDFKSNKKRRVLTSQSIKQTGTDVVVVVVVVVTLVFSMRTEFGIDV